MKERKPITLCRKATYLEFVTVTAASIAEAKRMAEAMPTRKTVPTTDQWKKVKQ
jgi:hypothetical protein